MSRDTIGPPVFIVPALGEPVEETDEPFVRHLRIYRAEDKAAADCPAAALGGTLADAQRYVDRIVRSAWWRRTCTPYSDSLNGGPWPVTRVNVIKGRQGGGLAFYAMTIRHDRRRESQATIRLGHGYLHGCPAIADPWVILHELAHVIASRDGHRGHARGFARVFLLTVERWLGRDAASALRDAYAAEGVKYRAKQGCARHR
jgi:hypothetical protein